MALGGDHLKKVLVRQMLPWINFKNQDVVDSRFPPTPYVKPDAHQEQTENYA